MSELKPCPFCGGEAKIKARYYRAINYFCYNGVCQECNASMDTKDTEAEAIEAWNTRHERMCTMHFYPASNLWRCSECVGATHAERSDDELPMYCQWCGARVVE